MAGMPIQPNVDTTVSKVRVAGQDIPAAFVVAGIEIVRRLDAVATARLHFYDGDAAKQAFDVSEAEVFVPGADIEIQVGYGDERNLLFKGVVVRQRIRAEHAGISQLHVLCKDAAYRMTTARRSRYFKELRDSQLFEDLAGFHELKTDVTKTDATHPEVVQYQVSDWDFLISRAERLGHRVLTLDGTLKVSPPEFDEPSHTLGYGDGIFDLDLSLDGRTQPGKVVARSWDAVEQEVLEAEAVGDEPPTPGDLSGASIAKETGPEAIELRHQGSMDASALDAWASAHLRQLRLSKVRGSVKVQGDHTLLPGRVVKLAGLGARFNGSAFVCGVTHRIASGDWLTELQVGLEPTIHEERHQIAPLPGDGFAPPVSGLHVGTVTDLEDPTGEDRVRVRIPLIDTANDGTWVRMARAYAGSSRAAIFRPEIGDEVAIAFIDGDPGQGVLLGALSSSARPAPIEASNKNFVKGIVTSSNLRLLFDDEAPKVTVATEKGNTIVVSDGDQAIKIEDQHGNRIEMNSDGIEIVSAGTLTCRSTGDVSIEGSNVATKASGNLSAEGSAQAQLSSSGTTVVKGSLVQIN